MAKFPRVDAEAMRGITIGLPSPINCPPLYGRFAEFLEQSGGTPQILSDHDAYSLDQFCHRRRLPVVWVGRLESEPARPSDIRQHLTRRVSYVSERTAASRLSKPGRRADACGLAGFGIPRAAQER